MAAQCTANPCTPKQAKMDLHCEVEATTKGATGNVVDSDSETGQAVTKSDRSVFANTPPAAAMASVIGERVSALCMHGRRD